MKLKIKFMGTSSTHVSKSKKFRTSSTHASKSKKFMSERERERGKQN